MKEKIPEVILNDLCSRFLINLPQALKDDFIQYFFHIEAAHWYYLDFYVDEDATLPKLDLKKFSARIFRYLPHLKPHVASIDKYISDWKVYKTTIPCFGAILMNSDCSKCVLVESYARGTKMFPRGKANVDEPELTCAIREVEEETGYNFSSLARPDNYLQQADRSGRVVRYYLVPGVSESQEFKPVARKEIRNVEWFEVAVLPTGKNDRSSAKKLEKLGLSEKSFFLVYPFVSKLRKWIATYRQEEQRPASRARQPRHVQQPAVPAAQPSHLPAVSQPASTAPLAHSLPRTLDSASLEHALLTEASLTAIASTATAPHTMESFISGGGQLPVQTSAHSSTSSSHVTILQRDAPGFSAGLAMQPVATQNQGHSLIGFTGLITPAQFAGDDQQPQHLPAVSTSQQPLTSLATQGQGPAPLTTAASTIKLPVRQASPPQQPAATVARHTASPAPRQTASPRAVSPASSSRQIQSPQLQRHEQTKPPHPVAVPTKYVTSSQSTTDARRTVELKQLHPSDVRRLTNNILAMTPEKVELEMVKVTLSDVLRTFAIDREAMLRDFDEVLANYNPEEYQARLPTKSYATTAAQSAAPSVNTQQQQQQLPHHQQAPSHRMQQQQLPPQQHPQYQQQQQHHPRQQHPHHRPQLQQQHPHQQQQQHPHQQQQQQYPPQPQHQQPRQPHPYQHQHQQQPYPANMQHPQTTRHPLRHPHHQSPHHPNLQQPRQQSQQQQQPTHRRTQPAGHAEARSSHSRQTH